MTRHTSFTRFATAGIAVAASLGLTLAGATSAQAATDPDRGICGDGTTVPNSLVLRVTDGSDHPVPDGLILTSGTQDHFYIEGEFTKSNGAHWYTGYGYDVDNGIKEFGAVLDSWIARSGGGCG